MYNGVAENINTQNSSEKAESKAEIDPLKVYVGNLPNNCTEGDLRILFERFGKVTEVRLFHPPTSPPCDYYVPSFAFIAFSSQESVQRVLSSGPIMLYGTHRVKVEAKKKSAYEASITKQVAPKSSSSATQHNSRTLPLLKSDLPKNKFKAESCQWRSFTAENALKILHVCNLPEDRPTENDLGELFEKYGKVTDVSIMPLPHNYAFVTFDSVEGVEKALAETRISIFGQRLNVARKRPRDSKLSTSSTCSAEDAESPLSKACTLAAHPPASKLRTFSTSSSTDSTSLFRSITASSYPPDSSSSKLPWANPVSSQEERHERVVKMPTMGPAVGISEKERDRQIFRELLGSSAGGSVQDDIFESDDEDEVADSEFESAAGNSRDCEIEEDQLKDGLDRVLTQLRNMALEKTFLEQDKKQLHAEKMELGKELRRANDGIAELVNQRLRDKKQLHAEKMELGKELRRA